MSTSWRSSDPDAGREADKYDRPVPSRTLILRHIEHRGAPARYEVLLEEFGLVDAEEQEGLRRRLIAMVRDGQLLKTRQEAFDLIDEADLIAGRVHGHREGFGFVIPDEGEDLFLTVKQMRMLFDGDRVVVRETDIDSRGRRYCAVVEVLERGVSQLVGSYHEEDGKGMVTPTGRRMTNELVVEPGALVPTQGQIVLVDIKTYPSRHQMAVGVVREILGHRMDPGMETDIAIHSYDIPHIWPQAVSDEVQGFSPEVPEEDKQHRVDMRDLPFVTIDGEDAKDFDDAVYARKRLTGGWRLFVAIADVSYYVKPGSELDKEACHRGTSVYFPGQVIPMLPEVLSNGLCSLNPHVDRLAMICEMTIGARGRLSGFRFYEGLIRSHARLTYSQVGTMLQEEEQQDEECIRLRREYASLVPHLESLYKLYNSLVNRRKKRGAIDFSTTETRIIFGPERKIDRIEPVHRNHAHKLIEECMLCANVAAAQFIEHHGLPGLFRVHEGPTERKRESLLRFLSERGLSLPGRAAPTPTDYQNLLAATAERSDAHVIQMMMLRSLGQAVYQQDNGGHFGLAYPAYTHFTSPIRRYPDLLVHRAIRAIVRSGKRARHVVTVKGASTMDRETSFPYDVDAMVALGKHCSMTERRADDASREVMERLKCEYMQKHLGEIYEGTVSAVTGFGLFVELKELLVSGLVHISSLPSDYYHFDPVRQNLSGEKGGLCFRLGDAVTVQVMRVDLEERNIDFELANSAARTKGVRLPAGKRKPRKKKGGGPGLGELGQGAAASGRAAEKPEFRNKEKESGVRKKKKPVQRAGAADQRGFRKKKALKTAAPPRRR